MRRTAVLVAGVSAALTVGGCGGDSQKATKKAATPIAYFGWVLGTAEPTGIAIEVAGAGGATKKIKAYVCDGLGPPKGKAVWFAGPVDTKVTNGVGQTVELMSAGKRETLDVDHFDDRLVKGSFTDSAGVRKQYVAYPARDGAGIYEVTLDSSLRYSGTSTDGSKLSAQADRRGLVTGDLTTADGTKIPFAMRTLALASPAELSSRGISSAYRKDVARSVVPGEYVAVIAPGGTHWLGRAGNVRDGNPAGEIIGLDKKEFTSIPRTQLNPARVGGATLSP
ncbi:MAG: hypothetical protein QOJ12_1669 [Thermoleophilales bacterium]|nr:hypothetical protein [Thermoleophilales bacterium]